MANTRQKLAGGVVIGVAALAFYLGTQWKGIGPGGTGTGFGSTATETESGEEIRASDLVGDEEVLATTAGSGGTAPQLLTVVMSSRDYFISSTGDLHTTTEADLSEVAHAAQTATGDSQGIRVRIYRKHDATVGIMEDLKRKLDQVGIPAQAVQFMDTSID